MSQQNTQVCPWCQMEITWDEELGPESNCPHCYNELSDYRTIAIPAKRDTAIAFDEEQDDDWYRYSRAAEKYLDAQDDVPECPQCQEYMVLAGETAVEANSFVQRPALETLPPFLTAPFRLDVFVCSHCFTVHQRLSQKDRAAIVRRLGEEQDD